MLNVTSLFSIFCSLVIFLRLLIAPNTKPWLLLACLLFMSNGLITRLMIKFGWLKYAGIISTTISFVLITASNFVQGTIRTPVAALYLPVVIVSGLLFELPGIIIATLASSLAVLVLIILEMQGHLPQPDMQVSITQWVTLTAVFLLTGSLSHFGNHLIKQALKLARKQVDERERTEQELHKLLRAVEQSPALIVITNLMGQIEYVNPRFTSVTGYFPREVLGKNPRLLKTELTPPSTYQALWSALLSGNEWRGEFVNRKKDGTIYCESATISPITDRYGSITHYLAVKEEITDRKQHEEALQRSEERFRALFEHTHDAVFFMDIHGHHINVNGQACEMLGYTPEEFKTITVNETSAENSESGQILQRLLAGETLPPYERRFRRKNGEIFPVEINVQLIRDSAGRPLRIQSMVRDISARKAAEEALRKANEQLNLRMAEVEALQLQLRDQAIRDPLTGLYNRRYLEETLERELARSLRDNKHVGIVLCDIDHFKHVNDRGGHPAGDYVLVELAKLLNSITRASDIICRYGGEEFLVVLPGIPPQIALQRAEEIRLRCEESRFVFGEIEFQVTVSVGVALYPDHSPFGDQVIKLADRSLYQAKNNGRNQVVVWNG